MEASRQFLKLKYILHLWHTLDLHILTWCMSRPIYVLRKVKNLWLSAYTEIHFNCLHSESSQNFMDLKNKFRNSGVVVTGLQCNCTEAFSFFLHRNIIRIQPISNQLSQVPPIAKRHVTDKLIWINCRAVISLIYK